MLQDIIRASERAADLTRQLLAYAGKGKFVIEPVNARRWCAISASCSARRCRARSSSRSHLHPDLPPIEGDASQIQQLVMNLILNAVEATGERPGVVRVTTSMRQVRPGDRVGHFRPDPPQPGTYISIEVMDDGCGMSEIVKTQIFDPFFTTKFTGRGLGLAAALGIVRGHKGCIGVESAEGCRQQFHGAASGAGNDGAIHARRSRPFASAARADRRRAPS